MKKANDTEGKFRVKSHTQRTKKDGSELPAYQGAPWSPLERSREGTQGRKSEDGAQRGPDLSLGEKVGV